MYTSIQQNKKILIILASKNIKDNYKINDQGYKLTQILKIRKLLLQNGIEPQFATD